MNDSLMQTYARQPVAFVRGEGAWLWDEEGRRYLDALAGVAVCALGHAHPAVADAICDQARTLVHTSNIFRIPLQEGLGARLCTLAGMERVFFCNSGAEANEAALKLARLHARRRGIDEPLVVVAEGSFHGRTLATLSATGSAKVRAGFEPLVAGFVRVPYGDAEALAAASAADGVVAVLIEPVQGEGGVNVPLPGYLPAVRATCDRHGLLMIADEIQTGMGRTGRWFAFQHEGAVPDVMTLAKGLGNGIPIGACLARGDAASLFGPGSHGSTFGGNPLACRAAHAVLDVIEEDGLCAHAEVMGLRLLNGLHKRLGHHPAVRAIRGKGLMVGIELDRPCAEIVGRALEKGLILNVTAERVIRLLPPLVITGAEAGIIIDTVSALVEEFAATPAG